MAGGDVVPVPPRARAQQPSRASRRGHHRQKAAWLPLDIIITEIAARSDPATLVRCAATCRDARRRIADDPSLGGRLRLRGTDRFVLPLLRGHLTEVTTYSRERTTKDMYMVDTAGTGTGAAGATRLVKAAATLAKGDTTARSVAVPVDSRGGLVLVRATTTTTMSSQNNKTQLLVCNPATGRRLALPPEPELPYDDDWRSTGLSWNTCGVQYVLLVGDGADAAVAVGRPFRVLMANLVLSLQRPHRRLLMHTYSSEHGAWSPLTEIPTLTLLGRGGSWSSRPLVVGDDVVHWLCMTGRGNYMLVLRVGVARVNVTSLPASFPPAYDWERRHLLATATAGGNPVVLVADEDKISAWEQSKHTRMWKSRPQVVIENETMLAFQDDGLAELERRSGDTKHAAQLLWFGEKSGAVLLRVRGHCLLWLDLRSKKIVRCFSSDCRMQNAKVYCPYELDLSSWVPTFSGAVTL